MEAARKKLKVYCETSFWSWLVSRPSTNPDHAVKQAWTRKWWEEAAPKCEIHVSEHVLAEAACRSLLDELHATPKPGLVDMNNNGSHSDMDAAMFERSTEALMPYFEDAHKTLKKCVNIPR